MSKSKNPTNTTGEISHEGGSFGAGLFLGLLGGITGMFLFGTKQGHQVLRDLKKQMEKQADELIAPDTKQKLIAMQKTATQWQAKFPKFPKKDPSA